MSDSSQATGKSLGDRLAQARQGRFVGRERELEWFRTALLAPEPAFVACHIHGPGGVGKSTLLQAFARTARRSGRSVLLLDGRDMELSPAGFSNAYQKGCAAQGWFDNVPADLALLIDTFELIQPLEEWLRQTFLRGLPSSTLVILAGRQPLSTAWRSDPDWGALTYSWALRNLRPEESQTYLTVRGVDQAHHESLLKLTYGHPLALSLLADLIGRGEQTLPIKLGAERDLVTVLLERFVSLVPEAKQRRALEICAHVRVTNEPLLAHFLGPESAPELFAWLASLSFIQQGPQGLFPHDLARDVLDADFRWRNPQAYKTLNHELRRYYQKKLLGSDTQAASADIVYLLRYLATLNPFFDWSILTQAFMEKANPTDYPHILASIASYEGKEALAIARYWLQTQPDAFIAFRTAADPNFAFVLVLMLPEFTDADMAADPAVAAAASFAQRHMPLLPAETVNIVRSWMGRDRYQTADVQALVAWSSSIAWPNHPDMAWTFACTAEPARWQEMFSHFNFDYSGEADFVVDGHHFGVFTHNWRREPFDVWFDRIGQQYFREEKGPPQVAGRQAASLVTLSQPDFAQAVREAMRDMHRPDLLAANPLLRSRLTIQESSPAQLRQLLATAAATLTTNPRDRKFYKAIKHTYLQPAPTQEAAAELLDLPLGTYRYRLARGLERITAWLWQREINP